MNLPSGRLVSWDRGNGRTNRDLQSSSADPCCTASLLISLLVGMLYGVMLPMAPRRQFCSAVSQCRCCGLPHAHGSLAVINPVMNSAHGLALVRVLPNWIQGLSPDWLLRARSASKGTTCTFGGPHGNRSSRPDRRASRGGESMKRAVLSLAAAIALSSCDAPGQLHGRGPDPSSRSRRFCTAVFTKLFRLPRQRRLRGALAVGIGAPSVSRHRRRCGDSRHD